MNNTIRASIILAVSLQIVVIGVLSFFIYKFKHRKDAVVVEKHLINIDKEFSNGIAYISIYRSADDETGDVAVFKIDICKGKVN